MIRTKLRSEYKKSIYKEGIIKTDQENAKVLNNYFSNISKILIFYNTIKRIQDARM